MTACETSFIWKAILGSQHAAVYEWYHLAPQHPVSCLTDMQSKPQANDQDTAAATRQWSTKARSPVAGSDRLIGAQQG